MTDAVNVFVRFRPKNQYEKDYPGKKLKFWWLDDNTLTIKSKNKKKKLTFDKVFTQETTQEEIFNNVINLKDFFDGVNCTILAYGATSSGKTHTIMGNEKEPGIIPRTLKNIFTHIEDQPKGIISSLTMSYVEIYSEKIKDLLQSNGNNLKLREIIPKNKENTKSYTYIENCTTQKIKSYHETMSLISLGLKHRATQSTDLNEHSSRSHAILILNLNQMNLNTNVRRTSKLYIVDLAGSEQVKKSNVTGDRLKEAQSINLSLSQLALVIKSLTTKENFIPYRNSTLTWLLKDSLGGNSKANMIMAVSPSAVNQNDTINTLKFGERAKKLPNKPKVNEAYSIETYKKLISDLKQQLEILQQNYNNALDLLRQHNIPFEPEDMNNDMLSIASEILEDEKGKIEEYTDEDSEHLLSAYAEMSTDDLNELKMIFASDVMVFGEEDIVILDK